MTNILERKLNHPESIFVIVVMLFDIFESMFLNFIWIKFEKIEEKKRDGKKLSNNNKWFRSKNKRI